MTLIANLDGAGALYRLCFVTGLPLDEQCGAGWADMPCQNVGRVHHPGFSRRYR
ncbi:hypothetical protein KDX32_31665 [Burkholderia ambifaria]|jgi:hypothetical protein|uniref:hypothetical protein n=1 Tax=Burkholderia ambifaria TaxID=152480 RepID=UPI001B94ABC2|nr:hypothetical protein [Burkholderia ambifaria]MBR8067617.1 hypothetical protein [Burkholderia ambifaria]